MYTNGCNSFPVLVPLEIPCCGKAFVKAEKVGGDLVLTTSAGGTTSIPFPASGGAGVQQIQIVGGNLLVTNSDGTTQTISIPSATPSGPVTNLDFSTITPTQLLALGSSLANNGGVTLTDAFGVPQGVLFPA